MKKIFVADQDEKFHTVMKSICEKKNVDLHIYTTSMEILPLIEQENPDLVFLNLELPDIDDFVMFDLLKKANTIPPIPVIITYTAKSENELQNYKNMKFQPQGYHKKPIKEKDIQSLLSIYLTDVSLAENEEYKNESNTFKEESRPLVEEDDIIFSEVLAENEMEENPIEALIDESQPKKPKEAIFKVSNDYVDLEERTAEKERAARLISLEKQNHFLMTENKRLQNDLKILKNNSIQPDIDFQNFNGNKKSYDYLEKQVAELNVKLTDKERELIAKDHEFEKKLRHEMDEMIRETEERLRSNIDQFYKNELNRQKEVNAKLQLEIASLKEMETSFNTSITNLHEEKNGLSQKINEFENEKKTIMKRLMGMEVDLANLEKEKEELKKEKDEKEKTISTALEKSTMELKLNREELKDYRNKIDMLGELLQKAITLTKG